MTLVAALNDLSTAVVANASGLLAGAFGQIIVTIVGLGLVAFLVYKFRGAIGIGK